jgi:excisionase family DNA binding protein
MNRLLRVPEVAAILGCGRTTVYHLIKQRQLPSVRVAGCRRVSQADLEAYIEALHGDDDAA